MVTISQTTPEMVLVPFRSGHGSRLANRGRKRVELQYGPRRHLLLQPGPPVIHGMLVEDNRAAGALQVSAAMDQKAVCTYHGNGIACAGGVLGAGPLHTHIAYIDLHNFSSSEKRKDFDCEPMAPGLLCHFLQESHM